MIRKLRFYGFIRSIYAFYNVQIYIKVWNACIGKNIPISDRRGYSRASERTAVRVSPFEKWECITPTPSLRVLGKIDVGGSADSTGVWIWTLLPTWKRAGERLKARRRRRIPLLAPDRYSKTKSRAMLVQRWTICKSVADRGHDVATSSSRFGLPSQTFAITATKPTTGSTASSKGLEDVRPYVMVASARNFTEIIESEWRKGLFRL